GKGANQAVQIARLGHHPRFVTPLGTDALAQSLRDELNVYGLSLQDALIKEGSSGIGLVSFLSDGSLTSTVVEGANGKVELSDLDTCRSPLEECDYLVAQLELPVPAVEEAIRIAAASGACIVLNTAPARPLSPETLAAVHYLIANEEEAGYYLASSVDDGEDFVRAGTGFALRHDLTMVVTLGPKGSLLFLGNLSFRFPALRVPVVETTGAGDSFVGALVVALAEGQKIEDACRFATCASAVTIQSVGGQRSMPDRAAVMSLYESHFT
ncbi:MAG: ribokinase, partial [Spirochaetota bacterium]